MVSGAFLFSLDKAPAKTILGFMGKRKAQKQPEAITVGVWLQRDEYERVKAAATKADRTVSNYIRLAVRERLAEKESA